MRTLVISSMLVWIWSWSLSPVLAENRALLIGIQNYRMGAFLPGIDKDLAMMTEVVQKIGYAKDQIRILTDEQATLAGLKKAFEEQLIQGVTPDDHVFLYFSGHGSRVVDRDNDEDDQADEVLLPYDFELKELVPGNDDKLLDYDKKKFTLDRVLLDDEFGRMIGKIQAGNILVFIDACHSGTATKGIGAAVNPGEHNDRECPSKMFKYNGMPMFNTKGSVAVENIPEKFNSYVSLSATLDNEVAWPSYDGSLFTMAVSKAVGEAYDRKMCLTLSELHKQVLAYLPILVKKYGKPSTPTPMISGNPALVRVNIFLDRPTPPPPPADICTALEELATKALYRVRIELNQPRYKVGDLMTIQVLAPADGYLNIFNADTGDETATVLYPNNYHQDNQVQGQRTVNIPVTGDRFQLKILPPGQTETTIAVFHTKEKINAFRQGRPLTVEHFKALSPETFDELRSLKGLGSRGASDKNGYGAGLIKVYIDPK